MRKGIGFVILAFLFALASTYAQTTDSTNPAKIETPQGTPQVIAALPIEAQSEGGSTVKADPPTLTVDQRLKCIELAIQAYSATMPGKVVSPNGNARNDCRYD